MKRIILFLLCLTSFPLAARSFVRNHDTQIWLHEYADVPLRGKVHVTGDFEQRWGGDVSTLYTYYFQGNLDYHFNKYFEIAPGYRHTLSLNPDNREWQTIKDPMLILRYHRMFNRWEVRLRNQNQYRMFENAPNAWLFRLRGEVFLPFRLPVYFPCKLVCLRPYIGDEVFFLQRVGFMENRAYVAIRFPVCGLLSSDLQWMLRSIKFDSWVHQQVIRWYLNLNF